jgi:hypothetical protein
MGRIQIGKGPSDIALQLVNLSDSLKEWSPDLYDVFLYMQTRKPELKGKAT